MTTVTELDELRARGEIVWENRRYGSTYAIDRPALVEQLTQHIPVLHLGQVEAIHAVTKATPDTRWLTVYLWCPRHIAATRIEDRGTGDTDARLRAWDETEPLPTADLVINTADITPDDAAHLIHHSVNHSAPAERHP